MKRKTFILSLISFIVLSLIVVYIVRYNNTDFSIPTFSSLLDTLSKAPDLSISLETIVPIQVDWGIFNFLRDFFNIFVKALNFLLWLGDTLLIFLEYVFYFLRWIFLG